MTTTFRLREYIHSLDIPKKRPTLMSEQPMAMIMVIYTYLEKIIQACSDHNIVMDNDPASTVLSDMEIDIRWHEGKISASMAIRDDGLAVTHTVTHECKDSTASDVFNACFCGLIEKIARGRVVSSLDALVTARKAITNAVPPPDISATCAVISHPAMVNALKDTLDTLSARMPDTPRFTVVRSPVEYIILLTFKLDDVMYNVAKRVPQGPVNAHNTCFAKLLTSVCGIIVKKTRLMTSPV